MIHARKDYNKIQDLSGKIPKDEPVFLLRGQDALAPALLIEWANRLEESGGDPIMASMVRLHADTMIDWQATHKRKIPDLP